ncbi:hypothetical protein SDC9_184468 [bioreactor metagenome]|uniref:Uncharacterized protein n=1 Tax=bioreactor metagenome TaxID=1076179 RepID=A0A645HEJ2_9ZZZZ
MTWVPMPAVKRRCAITAAVPDLPEPEPPQMPITARPAESARSSGRSISINGGKIESALRMCAWLMGTSPQHWPLCAVDSLLSGDIHASSGMLTRDSLFAVFISVELPYHDIDAAVITAAQFSGVGACVQEGVAALRIAAETWRCHDHGGFIPCLEPPFIGD